MISEKSPYRPFPRGAKLFLLIPLVFVLLLAGWYAVVRLVSPLTVVKEKQIAVAAPANPTSGVELTVGCFNIAHGRGDVYGAANWDGGTRDARAARLGAIAKFLQENKLDIVVLNEADFRSFWSGHQNQAEWIARAAGYPYWVEQRNVDVAVSFFGLAFGNAILSRFPVVETHFLNFPAAPLWQRLLVGGMKDGVAATLELPDGSRVLVAALHLSLESEDVRVASVRQVIDLQTQLALPAVVMGDFNTAPAGLPRHSLSSTGENAVELLQRHPPFRGPDIDPAAADAWFSFPSRKPDRVIDWIFVPASWTLEDYRVLPSDLSDHRPLVARVRR